MSATKISRVKSEWQLFTKLDVMIPLIPGTKKPQRTSGGSQLMASEITGVVTGEVDPGYKYIRTRHHHLHQERWTACGGHWLAQPMSTLSALRRPLTSYNGRSKRETSLGHDGEWRVRFAPACGQPSPTFFPCLVWSYHVSRSGSTLCAIGPITIESLRPLPEASSSWFSCRRTFNFLCWEPENDEMYYTHRGERQTTPD